MSTPPPISNGPPLRDNSNILWNKHSLGVNLGLKATLTFHKTVVVYHLKRQKGGLSTPIFLLARAQIQKCVF